jgi:hypothetical protein
VVEILKNAGDELDAIRSFIGKDIASLHDDDREKAFNRLRSLEKTLQMVAGMKITHRVSHLRSLRSYSFSADGYNAMTYDAMADEQMMKPTYVDGY